VQHPVRGPHVEQVAGAVDELGGLQRLEQEVVGAQGQRAP
jgi:hypothetical protein